MAGAVARLIRENAWYAKLRDTVVETGYSADDFREMAPAAVFGGLLPGAL